MTALAKDTFRSTKHHTVRLEAIPVKGGETIYHHALVNSDANGLAVPAAPGTGLVFRGVAYRGFDNADGADGVIGNALHGNARFCEVDGNGPWSFAVEGTAPKGGEPAYVHDDNTVKVAAGSNPIKVGLFIEPDPLTPGNWFVDVERAKGV